VATVQQLARAQPPERRFVLRGIPWDLYEALRANVDNHRVRMSYDGGTLEMMSPSGRHESIKHLIRRMIDTFTEELEIPVRGLSATTWKRRDLDKGLEADECYYIRNHHLVSATMEVDLATDPPPDLALEVEVYHGDVDKIAIYAALGVPEIWRWRDDVLETLILGDDGRYVLSDFSLNLPLLRVKDLEPFLDWRRAADESAWIRSFRQWVRQRFGHLP
jgi:Uma2 family endonuclease